MNKDVIYIEPEDDITDILANIKNAKNKIVALVPPKKAGVLRSAVNFKLIAKTATQAKKTVVLISSDESLLKLADKAKMPTAKSLQSKPKLPTSDDAEEFGEEKDDDMIEDDAPADAKDDDVAEEEKADEEPKKADAKKEDAKEDKAPKKVTAASSKKKAPDMEIDDEDFDDESDKKSAKKTKANKNIPNFNKVRKPLIIGVIAFLILFGGCFWAFAIAPAAKIVVKIRTSPQSLSESVKFVTDESKADPEKGVFYISQKTITKNVEASFKATGEIDKGTKATGNIRLVRTSPVPKRHMIKITVDAGTQFKTESGLAYVTTQAVELPGFGLDNCDPTISGAEIACNIKSTIEVTVGAVAAENGDKFNIAEGTSLSHEDGLYQATIAQGGMTGGTSKKVKVVSKKDVETAEAGLENEGESEAREELMRQFNNTYLLIENSFTAAGGKISASPAIDEEVKDGVEPKVIKEVKYTIYAVERDALNKFIKAKANVGDDTQVLYSTGLADVQDDNDKGRIESFKNDKDGMTGVLKTVVRTGPDITEQWLAETALGRKIGEVQSLVKSRKGVSEVKVHTSYFWVTSVPDDPNKVSYEISVE